MELGMIGLGRMGANMSQRLVHGGHRVVGRDLNPPLLAADDVPAPVITHSLIQRLRSRDTDSFADKLLSAMRNQFGGHAIKRQ